jgi:hypothetical protein
MEFGRLIRRMCNAWPSGYIWNENVQILNKIKIKIFTNIKFYKHSYGKYSYHFLQRATSWQQSNSP